jgi:hypothetical protein
MMVYTATFIASSVSGLCLVGCLLLIASIYNDVQRAWLELDQEIGVFRVIQKHYPNV